MNEGETTQSAQEAASAQGAPDAAEQPSGGGQAAEAPAGEQVAKASEAAGATADSPADGKGTLDAATAEGVAPPEGGDEFMRDLVAAMRAVAEEARQTGVSELKSRTDEQVLTLEAEAELRKTDLRRLADADVAGVGEWAAAEADRIKSEAEQRVVARRARLDQELAADAARTEAETKAVRERLADYERELEAYHAQLGEINDPAAFAAAAKRLPKPPALGGSAAAASTPPDATDGPSPDAAAASSSDSPSTNGVPAETEAEAPSTEVLASRMAELDAALPEGEPAAEADASAAEATPAAEPAADEAPAAQAAEAEAPAEPAPDAESAPAAAAPTAGAESTVTEVVVKGLGSFGAITGFRQALSGVDGIDSVALSLGQTGEFVFRATHGQGFDVKTAIIALEGDGAKIETRPEGGLRVTLERAR